MDRERSEPQRGNHGKPQSRPRQANAGRQPDGTQRRRTEEQQRRRQEQQRKRHKQAQRVQRSEKRRQETQRSPARPLPRRKLVLKLVTTLAVVAALLLSVTIFFKVRVVKVTGNKKYTAQEVIEAAGIEIGENLLTFGENKAVGKILAQLSYVDQVQIGIKLPNTVNIDIVETEAVYAIRDSDGGWWLINRSGKLLEPLTDSNAHRYPQVLGVQAKAPAVNRILTPMEEPEPEEGQETTEPVGTPADRLDAAIQILTELEKADRTGKITTVDVSDLYDLQIWYGEEYQVLLSGPSDLSYKVRYMVEAIERMEQEHYGGGILDLSFQEEGKAVFTPW